jgi:uncharacterized membrane protein YdcZ (DUF606 family)
MKNLLLLILVLCCCTSQAQDASKGHPEHILAGMAIGGVTSYLVYRKTNNKFKSWAIGTGAATVIGLAKELIDPSIGRERSAQDFGYTVLGGVIGASVVFPLKKRTPKEVAYLF